MKSSHIQKTLLRCPSLSEDPCKLKTEKLKEILRQYNDVMDSMCNEDGWVNTYERLAEKLTPFQDELDRREKQCD